MNIASKEYVVKRLTELMITPKKKYSQNFLTDFETVSSSLDALNVQEDEIVIEIGPGLGALTQELLRRNYQVYAYEIDEDMYKHLDEVFKGYSNFHLFHLDFLKADLKEYQGKKIKFISNVPYNLTTPIIERIVTSSLDVKAFEFMVQKEVYDRIKAKSGSKDYAPLNIFIEYVGVLSLVKKVTKDKFIPAPNVDSVILKIEFNKERVNEEQEKEFFKITKACFSQRRKTLLNNLGSYLSSKEEVRRVLEEANLKENLRGEQLLLKDYLNLSAVVLKRKK